MRIITQPHFHHRWRCYNQKHIFVKKAYKLKRISRDIWRDEAVSGTNILFHLKSNLCCNVIKIIREPNDIDLLLI